MEQISFKDWRVAATIVDTDILRLEVEALDGSDIIEMGGAGVDRGGEEYQLHLSSQRLEDRQRQRPRRAEAALPHENDDDETSSAWLADEDESIYLRNWEVDALVDEDGLLTVTVTRGEGAEIYEVEPLESDSSLSPRIVVRLASEDSGDDEDDEEEEDQAENDEDLEDEYDEFDVMDELEDDYDLEDEGMSTDDDVY